MNRGGPSIEPWRTPSDRGAVEDVQLLQLLMLMNCCLSLRYDFRQEGAGLMMLCKDLRWERRIVCVWCAHLNNLSVRSNNLIKGTACYCIWQEEHTQTHTKCQHARTLVSVTVNVSVSQRVWGNRGHETSREPRGGGWQGLKYSPSTVGGFKQALFLTHTKAALTNSMAAECYSVMFKD